MGNRGKERINAGQTTTSVRERLGTLKDNTKDRLTNVASFVTRHKKGFGVGVAVPTLITVLAACGGSGAPTTTASGAEGSASSTATGPATAGQRTESPSASASASASGTPTTGESSPSASLSELPPYINTADTLNVACNDQLASNPDAQRGSTFDSPFPATRALSVTTADNTESLVGTDPAYRDIGQPLQITTFVGNHEVAQQVLGRGGPIAVAVYGSGVRVVFTVSAQRGAPDEPARQTYDDFTACRRLLPESQAGPHSYQAGLDARETEKQIGVSGATIYTIGPRGTIVEQVAA